MANFIQRLRDRYHEMKGRMEERYKDADDRW
jgi:hypothetical protein